MKVKRAASTDVPKAPLGRPSSFPLALAAASPSLVRSEISLSSSSAGRMPPFEDKENRPASSVCCLLTVMVQSLRPRHSVRDRHGCLMAQAVTRNLGSPHETEKIVR